MSSANDDDVSVLDKDHTAAIRLGAACKAIHSFLNSVSAFVDTPIPHG